MNDQIQTEDIKNHREKELVEEIAEKTPKKPESDELQKVAKERIERMKKAFKPTWLVRQLDSQDDKKGK